MTSSTPRLITIRVTTELLGLIDTPIDVNASIIGTAIGVPERDVLALLRTLDGRQIEEDRYQTLVTLLPHRIADDEWSYSWTRGGVKKAKRAWNELCEWYTTETDRDLKRSTSPFVPRWAETARPEADAY